ncbi:hypothetical protein BD414DRAFT_467491 [Trametes punicea]|nr:hypothetical protein BD414DRAFT_467491 [Trametes punicea]
MKGKKNLKAEGRSRLPNTRPKDSAATAPNMLLVAALAHPLSTATREEVSQYAMLSSITNGAFEDVKFYAFSRRIGPGQVDTARPLFANSALICKASSHFDFVFSAGFAESEMTNMDAPYPSHRASQNDAYDYAEDSDLDPEHEEAIEEADESPDIPSARTRSPSVVSDPMPRSMASSPLPRTFSPPIRSEDTLPPTNSPAAVPVADEEFPLPSNNTDESAERKGFYEYEASPVDEHRSGAPKPSGNNLRSASGRVEGAPSTSGRKGRVVFIDDFAYRTWAAFIFYAYFDTVSFAPLKSRGKGVTQDTRSPAMPYEPPQCSPKSMYRLAEKYGIERLKDLAAANLQGQLTAHNILVELFSPFTSMFAGVQAAEMEYLVRHISEPDTLKDIPRWIRYLEEGRLPRGSGTILSTLVTSIVRNGRRGW